KKTTHDTFFIVIKKKQNLQKFSSKYKIITALKKLHTVTQILPKQKKMSKKIREPFFWEDHMDAI
ncbi:hypothetical protein, partial [Bartonella vinsonii]|uniref:hypothetical protein n=1 Tax=Bartonella vinsonii TaxID=33047 RepID=UPI001ABB1452